MRLINCKIILTGASSGIGAELCRLLASDNTIFAVALDDSNIMDHPNVYKHGCDLGNQANIDIMFALATEKMGGVDFFFANAGFAYYGQFHSSSWDDLLKIYNTNVLSVIYSLRKMRELKGNEKFGFAITASAMSFLAMPSYAIYSSTKFALRGFSDSVRSELKNNQDLFMIYPIATITSFFENAGAKNLPWPRQKAPKVAKIIIRGVNRKQYNIFPSIVFRLMLTLDRIIPVLRVYRIFEIRRIRKFKKQDYGY